METKISQKDLQNAEQTILAAYRNTRSGSSVKVGQIEVIGDAWRRNPPSGVVTDYCRVSFKLNGKKVSRAVAYQAAQS